jgi:hypothetical protein
MERKNGVQHKANDFSFESCLTWKRILQNAETLSWRTLIVQKPCLTWYCLNNDLANEE